MAAIERFRRLPLFKLDHSWLVQTLTILVRQRGIPVIGNLIHENGGDCGWPSERQSCNGRNHGA